jgi:Ca2+-binding EF-hand superfamily protein
MSKSPSKLKNIIVNKDGKREIVNLESIPAETLEFLRKAFANLDSDNSGQIGLQELMEFQADIGHPLTEQEVIEAYFKDDVNGDFQLTFEEFAARMASREKIIDDEVIAAFKHFNGKMKYMDVGQLKYILTQMGGEEKFSEEDFQALLRETGHKITDKFDYELYVKEWRSKMEDANQEQAKK